MRIRSLKYDLLEWLYQAYQKDPLAKWDVGLFMEEHGISAVSSILEFGNALKKSGHLKEFNGQGYESFQASISILGIDLISEDVKNEVHQLLDGLKNDMEHFYPVVNHLQFLPKTTEVAAEICHYMQNNGLIISRTETDDVFIKITAKGIEYLNHPSGPYNMSGSPLRKIA
jgi:hypothetical protein